jgi:hypothetical protein
LAVIFTTEDWDYGGGFKLDGQNNTFILNCTCDGKRGMETIS